LSVEAAFYVAFPLLLRLALRARLRNLVLLSLAVWLLTQIIITRLLNTPWYQGYPSASHDLLYFFPPVHFCSFLLGICGARLLAARNAAGAAPAVEFWSGARTIGLCALTLAVLEARLPIQQSLSFLLPFYGSLLSPLFLLLILQLALGHDRWARALSLPPLVALGRASYSFYILQRPVFRLFEKLGSPHLPDNADLRFWTFVVALGAISILSQKFIEAPAAKMLRRLQPAMLSKLNQIAPVVTQITATKIADS